MIRATALTALVFASLSTALALLQAPSDPDMFWHLSSGEWTLDHGVTLDHDVWSFTRTGQGYAIGAWLGQTALALGYRAAGWLGLDILRAALVGIAVFFVARTTLRVQPHVGWAAIPVIGTALVSRMVWGDRPQLFTLALFPIVLDVLFVARLEHRARALIVLPPLFLLWANLHNSFLIGIAATAVFVIESWLERDALRRPLSVAFAASVAATLLNPSGVGAITRAFGYAGTRGGYVVEEAPLDVLTGAGLVFAFLLLAAVGAAMLRGRDGIAARLGAPLLWPGLIIPFALLALAIQRNTPYACMVLAPFVAAMGPEMIGRPRLDDVLRVPRAVAAVFAALVLIALGIEAAVVAPRDPDLARYPSGALAALRPLRGNMLNEYDWGGYLIRYAPEHPTFIDGRGGALFTRDVLDDFAHAVALAPDYHAVLTRWDIAIALLRADRPLAAALREDGWRVAASSDLWVLLVRP